MNLALFFSLLNVALFIGPMIFAIYKRDWLVAMATPVLAIGVVARILQDPQPPYNLPTILITLVFCLMTAVIFIDHTNYRNRIVVVPEHLKSKGRAKVLFAALGFMVITVLLMLILAQAVDNGRLTEEELNAPGNKEQQGGGQAGSPGEPGQGSTGGTGGKGGDAGPQGIQGTTGSTGNTGGQGVQGTQGVPGPMGPAGPPAPSQGLVNDSVPILGRIL